MLHLRYFFISLFELKKKSIIYGILVLTGFCNNVTVTLELSIKHRRSTRRFVIIT